MSQREDTEGSEKDPARIAEWDQEEAEMFHEGKKVGSFYLGLLDSGIEREHALELTKQHIENAWDIDEDEEEE